MQKKLLTTILSFVLLAGVLAGCSDGGTVSTSSPVSPSASQTPDSAEPAGDTGDYRPEKIVVAIYSTNVVPIVQVEGDEVIGHEADIWHAIEDLTGVPVEFYYSSDVFGDLDAGNADTVASQITLNAARQEKYNFAEPYAYMPEKCLVREDFPYDRLADLDGRAVGYASTGNGGNLFEQIAEKYDISLEIIPYEGEAVFQALYSGIIDATIVPAATYSYRIAHGTIEGRLMDEAIVYGAKGYPFRKGDEEAERKRQFVEDALAELRDNGTLTELSTEWYGEDFTYLPDGVEIAN